jgi:hypothetical protein
MTRLDWTISETDGHLALDPVTADRLPYQVRAVSTLSGRGKPNYLALTRTDGRVFPCSERIANPDPLSHDRWLTWQAARKACEQHYAQSQKKEG